MADPAKYRTEQDVEQWKSRDPLRLMGEKLDAFGLSDLRVKIEEEIEAEIQDGVEFAENAAFPDPATVNDYVLV